MAEALVVVVVVVVVGRLAGAEAVEDQTVDSIVEATAVGAGSLEVDQS